MSMAATLGIPRTIEVCRRLSPERAIMLRGRPGIGKSQVVYQIAAGIHSDFYKVRENCEALSKEMQGDAGFAKILRKFWKKNAKEARYADYPRNIWHYDMGLPVMERRLSQLTEGDIVGLPFEGTHGTCFRPTEWMLTGTRFPLVLFLDELNRALKGVEQATFQLADSKAFYGYLLHSETRLYTAVNIGDAFDVSPMDPAAISRYAVIDLTPSVEDWIEWAKGECSPFAVEFIRSNPALLEHDGVFEPNKKYPDRRAWANLDVELTTSGLYDTPQDTLFVQLCATMLGFEVASKFWQFCKEYKLEVSAKDVLKDWETAKRKFPPTTSDSWFSKMVETGHKVSDHVAQHTLTKEQAQQLAMFMNDAPPEPIMAIWQNLYKIKANFNLVSPMVGQKMLSLMKHGTHMANGAATPAKTK